jgi:hypothetical protein
MELLIQKNSTLDDPTHRAQTSTSLQFAYRQARRIPQDAIQIPHSCGLLFAGICG